MGYATVADYELLTGTVVPAPDQDTVLAQLDFASSLIAAYLGPYEESVSEAYPDVLTGATVYAVQRAAAVPVGIRSESAGSTSVSYDTGYGSGDSGGLPGYVRDILDGLMGKGKGALGVISFGW